MPGVTNQRSTDPAEPAGPPSDVVVRPMAPDEFAAMRTVAVAAFDDNPDIGVLVDALRESWAWRDDLAFVAERRGDLVGQVLYTRALLDTPERLVDVLVLSPIGVRPDLQGQGIGGRLINETLALLADRAERLVFLEGSPRYYPRFGFAPGGDHGFRRPSLRIPPPAFQVRAVGPGPIDPGLNGTVVYPDAFWRTDSVGLR